MRQIITEWAACALGTSTIIFQMNPFDTPKLGEAIGRSPGSSCPARSSAASTSS